MKYFAATAALVSAIPGIVSLTINTPSSVVQCQPQLLSWSEGVPPYYLSVIPGGQPSSAPIKSFATQSGNSVTWTVDIAGGTAVTFALKDSTGNTAYTDTVNIQKGSDSSCMNGGAPAPSVAVDTANTGSAPASVNSDPAPAPAAPASQAPDASSSIVSSTGTSRGVVSAGITSSAARITSTLAGAVATQSRAVSITSAVSASASRAATTSTSGATSRLTATGFGLVGCVALIGAMFL